MEADWEVEIGGGAPVIEALWPGFIDLRRNPERIGEIPEASAFPPLAGLLQALNGSGSPLWTAKCGLWEPQASELANVRAVAGEAHAALACYIDLLPHDGLVFAQWEHAEAFCREWAARLSPIPLPACRVDLVVRLALAGKVEGFGITAYASAEGSDRSAAAETLAAALAAFAGSIPPRAIA